MEAATSIGIVGGGSVAVSFLAQLVLLLAGRSDTDLLKVLVFEPCTKLGPGGAYGDDINSNLLNIPAGNMSAYATDRRHFFKWLNTLSPQTLNGYGVAQFEPSDFLPRPLFGRYLEQVYADTLKLASKNNIEVIHIQDRVVAASRLADGIVQLATAHGQPYRVNKVVLCNGNLPPVSFKHLDGDAGFFNSPYPVKNLVDNIDKRKSVCVIGTSLSAVDAVVALKQAGHIGTIVCVSRNGRLPAVRSEKNSALPAGTFTRQEFEALAQKQGGQLTLQAVLGKLCEKVAAFGGSMVLNDVLGHGAGQVALDAAPPASSARQATQLPTQTYGPSAHEILDQEIVLSTETVRIWQSVAASANEVIDFVWHLLPRAEKEHFHQKWRSLWMTRRATFPMKNALKLQAYFAEGGLHIEPGFMRCDHDPVNKKFCIELKRQGSSADQSGSDSQAIVCDYVINATSFSVDVAQSNDLLIGDLIASGDACADPFGGFRLDFDSGCLVNSSGSVFKEMSVLGSLAVGTYFWTISMDVNARLAYKQAQRIASEISTVQAL